MRCGGGQDIKTIWVCQINKSTLGIVFFLAAEKTTAIILVHRRQERPLGSKGGKVGKAKVAFTLVDEKGWKIRLGGRYIILSTLRIDAF